ncbi:MAG: hypothetical protein LBR86_00085 [Tannerella sp.]|nr:hypothetical protein [Tannerella sp.]
MKNKEWKMKNDATQMYSNCGVSKQLSPLLWKGGGGEVRDGTSVKRSHSPVSRQRAGEDPKARPYVYRAATPASGIFARFFRDRRSKPSAACSLLCFVILFFAGIVKPGTAGAQVVVGDTTFWFVAPDALQRHSHQLFRRGKLGWRRR